MKWLSIAIFVCLCATNTLSAQEPLLFPDIQKATAPFASPNSRGGAALSEVTKVATANRESAEYRYQKSQERAETPREAVIRVAKEKGEQRRYRLALQKAMGISTLRPTISPDQGMGTCAELWYGGRAVPGYAYPQANDSYGRQYQGAYHYSYSR